MKQLYLHKMKNRKLKTLLSIGGWTWKESFPSATSTAANRKRFATSAVKLITDWGMDGIDIDWEYPVGGGVEGNKTRPADKQNYTLLLAELRKELDAQGKADGKSYLLTIAAPAGPATYANLELEKVARHIDWFNLMAYDFHGGWSPLTHS